MNAEGIVFLGRTRPQANTSSSGTFQLTLLAMDRIGTHQVEPWRITWAGDEARTFWNQHQDKLLPGQPLRVVISRIQPMSLRHCAPEIHGQARHIEIAPRSTDREHATPIPQPAPERKQYPSWQPSTSP